jgi:hypothetical protein
MVQPNGEKGEEKGSQAAATRLFVFMKHRSRIRFRGQFASHSPALSLSAARSPRRVAGVVEGPLATRHCFSISNRVTYEKLEIDLTHTKQSPGLVSNRGNCRSSCPNLHFRTPLAAPKFRAMLPRALSHRKMLFFKPDRLIIREKQNHIARSRASKFLIGQKTPSREESTC